MTKPDIASNPAATVDEYRRVISQRDAANNAIDRAEYQGIAGRMRAAWQEWAGDDDLHEMAFGEPAE